MLGHAVVVDTQPVSGRPRRAMGRFAAPQPPPIRYTCRRRSATPQWRRSLKDGVASDSFQTKVAAQTKLISCIVKYLRLHVRSTWEEVLAVSQSTVYSGSRSGFPMSAHPYICTHYGCESSAGLPRHLPRRLRRACVWGCTVRIQALSSSTESRIGRCVRGSSWRNLLHCAL